MLKRKPDPASVPVKTIYPQPNTEKFRIEAIVDKNTLEIFVNDGELYYTLPFNNRKNGKIDVFAGGDSDRKAILKNLEVHQLASIWNNQ